MDENVNKKKNGLMEYYSSNPKYAVFDGGAVILSLITLIALIAAKGIKFGLMGGIGCFFVLIVLAQVLKKTNFAEPTGIISEDEPEPYMPVKEEEEEIYMPGTPKKEKASAGPLDLDAINAATEQKETLAQKAAKLGGVVVDTKNSVKGTLLRGKHTLDEFTEMIVGRGTTVSSLTGEAIFSNPEFDGSAPLNIRVDNGIYSGAFDLVEVQKVPYYGYSSVLLKLLDGEMYTYFDSAVKWTGIPFDRTFIGHIDKRAKSLSTLGDKSARMAVWIKSDEEIYVLETAFISTNVSDTNAFNEIKKYILTTILSKIGNEAKDTYIECGVCEVDSQVLAASKAAQSSLDKALIQGQCDFKIPDILLGVNSGDSNTMDTPANMDYILSSVEGVELKRCANTSDSSYTMFTYVLDSLAAKKFFNAGDTMIKLNTTVYKPSLVRDMLKWVIGQYSEVADSIAIDVSTGIGMDTIHVLCSSNGITFDSLVDVPDAYLSNLFRMNSVSAYSGVSAPTDIRVLIHSTGRELFINEEDYKIKSIGKMAVKE